MYIYFLFFAIDRVHGMNNVIGEKPATSPPVSDFNASDEDR